MLREVCAPDNNPVSSAMSATSVVGLKTGHPVGALVRTGAWTTPGLPGYGPG